MAERSAFGSGERLAFLKGRNALRASPPAYAKTPEDNLIRGVSKNDFWADLESGGGHELTEMPRRPAKFCAAYSSTALVVNSFGPFRRTPKMLVLAGSSGYTEARFERKCLNGLQGGAPNLDFFAVSPTSVVGVESKFLEPLETPEVKFPDQYRRAMNTRAEPVWRHVYKTLLDNPKRFMHLDVAQLVKHYLGIWHSFRSREGLKALMYLYWEPMNSDSIPEFVAHRRELSTLAAEVQGSEVKFIFLSYPQLWQMWLTESPWEGIRLYVEALRRRYAFEI